MCTLAGKALFRRPFHWNEFIVQTWFITRVALLPTIAVSIPLTVLIVFTLNTLLAAFGAADILGRGRSPGRRHPARPADHRAGSGRRRLDSHLRRPRRTHHPRRDRCDGGSSASIRFTGWWYRGWWPRRSSPRCLNGTVITIGLVGGFLFGVKLQNVSGGAYLATLTLVTGLPEVLIATIKAAIFGTIAGLVGCYRGLTTKGGPKGVGVAVNEDAGALRDRTVRGQRRADHDRRPVSGRVADMSTAAVVRARFPRTVAGVKPLRRRHHPRAQTRPGT